MYIIGLSDFPNGIEDEKSVDNTFIVCTVK